jgi:hypothetical protein
MKMKFPVCGDAKLVRDTRDVPDARRRYSPE